MAVKSKKERKNILWRLIVFIISGIVLDIWAYAVAIVLLINWFVVIFSGKRNKELGYFCSLWAMEITRFVKYLSFETNEKPFPFKEKRIEN